MWLRHKDFRPGGSSRRDNERRFPGSLIPPSFSPAAISPHCAIHVVRESIASGSCNAAAMRRLCGQRGRHALHATNLPPKNSAHLWWTSSATPTMILIVRSHKWRGHRYLVSGERNRLSIKVLVQLRKAKQLAQPTGSQAQTYLYRRENNRATVGTLRAGLWCTQRDHLETG